uniref:Secretin n=1 Tax=Pelodiscus sinensis TaxID=13735 RepID=K7GDD8_PELSI
MASLRTGLWQLVISVVVLSQLSATLPLLESPRARRHADGVFNSELSKMNENAYVQKLVKYLVGLNERYQRHADGMFTSELSKMRENSQFQKLIKSLVGYKRSHSPIKVSTSEQKHENGNSYEDFCFMWLYHHVVNDSLSESDAREAIQTTGQYLCSPLIEEMKAEVSALD